MEWYESLFLQMCTHALSRARVADLIRQDGKLYLKIKQTSEIVASYKRSVGVAFSLKDVKDQFSSGAEHVVAVFVRENSLSSALQQLNGLCCVVLSASMQTGARSSELFGFYVDVAFCCRDFQSRPSV